MKYSAVKYSGGVNCGNGYFDTLDECFEFADDCFCDYVRVTNLETGQVLKIHFEPKED